jgi:hypothetical protein
MSVTWAWHVGNFTAVTITHVLKKKFQGYVIYFKMPKSIHNNLLRPWHVISRNTSATFLA